MSRMAQERIDRAERLILASKDDIFQAFVEPALLEKWLPPAGMSGRVHEIDPKEGGGYVMSLYYEEDAVNAGKTSKREDRFRVVFDELKPGLKIVQRVVFDASDPSFAGSMKQTWTFLEKDHMTNVSVVCENVPQGIRPEDHSIGLNSSLANLAMAIGAVD